MKAIRKFPNIGYLLLPLLFSQLPYPALASKAKDCVPAFSNIYFIQNDPAAEFAQRARLEIEDRSRSLVESLQKSTAEGKPKKVNLVIIGGGPHSHEVYSSFHDTNPKLEAVIFEGTKKFGTFDRFGPSFSMNSIQGRGGNANVLYGSAVPAHLFNPEKDIYLLADRAGNASVLAHHAAKSPLALEQWVQEIIEQPEGANWPGRYLVKTNNGISVYTDVIVPATGIGTPSLGVKDPASLALAAEEMAKAKSAEAAGKIYIPLVEPLDDALPRAAQLKKNGVAIEQYYKPGEKIGVTGGSHGAMIAAEGAAGETPHKHGLIPGQPSSAEIFWLGLKPQDFPSFKTFEKRRRYWNTMHNMYESGRMHQIPGHVLSWRRTTPEEAKLGKLAVTMEGLEKPVYLDKIITGTGYENKVNKLFEGLVPKSLGAAERAGAIEQVPVMGELDQSFKDVSGAVQLTNQVVVAGKKHDIFLAGEATGWQPGKEFSDKEWKSSGSFLATIGRRSETLGHMVASRFDVPFETVVLKPAEAASSLQLSLPPVARVPNPVSAEIDLRVQMQRALYGTRLPPSQLTELAFSRAGTAATLSGKLDPESLERVRSLIDENAELKKALADYLLSHPGEATLSISAKGDGRAIFESMNLSATKK